MGKKISRNHKSEVGRVKSFIGYSGSGPTERNPSRTSWHFTTYSRQVIIIPYRVHATVDIVYSRPIRPAAMCSSGW